MRRTIECPRCGIRVQSKFMTDPNKVPRHVGWLNFCPVCGVRLSLVKDKLGNVTGAVRERARLQSVREVSEGE